MVNFDQPHSLLGPNRHRMNNDISDYERLCDEELAAADLADSKDARIAHLEQAFRFAKKAIDRTGGSRRERACQRLTGAPS